ncbi:MAG: SDR family oxidoreductase [Acetobacteraceae bacterium]|nr:SDR family oxidoreductase [Pseudomonadota bacterium]
MTSGNNAPSRRGVIVGATTGLAAALASATPNRAQAAQAVASPGAGQAPLSDPRTDFPRPPFPGQEQPWPGLASRMTPRPDHGEDSYKGSGRLAGRKALITGGDSGIGRAAAIAFAREGADVAINYLPAEEPDAQEVVQLVRAAGRKAVALPGDIQDERFCNDLVSNAVSQLGGLDIVVSNAARQVAQDSILDISTEQFDATFKTNVYAMFWIIKAAVPHLQPGSTIIATTSVNAYEPGETIIDYAATKGAIMILVKGLAKQLASKGIRVNGVAPGPVWTPLQVTGGQPADRLPQFGGNTPMGRPGQPVELAPLYVLLASDESTYSTGQIFGAVGGRGGP